LNNARGDPNVGRLRGRYHGGEGEIPGIRGLPRSRGECNAVGIWGRTKKFRFDAYLPPQRVRVRIGNESRQPEAQPGVWESLHSALKISRSRANSTPAAPLTTLTCHGSNYLHIPHRHVFLPSVQLPDSCPLLSRPRRTQLSPARGHPPICDLCACSPIHQGRATSAHIQSESSKNTWDIINCA